MSVRFCIEEGLWDDESKTAKKFVGKVDNFTDESDSSKHLAASQEAGTKLWEGVSVEITE